MLVTTLSVGQNIMLRYRHTKSMQPRKFGSLVLTKCFLPVLGSFGKVLLNEQSCVFRVSGYRILIDS